MLVRETMLLLSKPNCPAYALPLLAWLRGLVAFKRSSNHRRQPGRPIKRGFPKCLDHIGHLYLFINRSKAF